MMTTKFKRYKIKFDYSYSPGVFPTIELLSKKPSIVKQVILHTKSSHNIGLDKIINLCILHNVPYEYNDRTLSRLYPKGNIYALGVFNKQSQQLSEYENHLLLVNPESLGNVGTIMRTMAAFDCSDLALIRPAVDVYNPTAVRSSMGAIFRARIQYFQDLDAYLADYKRKSIYTFFTNGEIEISSVKPVKPHTLVFGSESKGLPDIFRSLGTQINIPITAQVDSLNISISVGIALHHFYTNRAHHKQ